MSTASPSVSPAHAQEPWRPKANPWLAAHVTPYDPETQQTLFSLSQHMSLEKAYAVIYGRVLEQAALWGYVSNFRSMALLCAGCVALAFVFRKVQAQKGPIEVH